ncbi:MAG: hypothetical protein ACYTG1_08695 [Planctomycetota bacterium]|jgi:hypothetical protein
MHVPIDELVGVASVLVVGVTVLATLRLLAALAEDLSARHRLAVAVRRLRALQLRRLEALRRQRLARGQAPGAAEGEA